ncbi:DNA polymerase III subunit delta [Agrilactobacillus yilanensis]|uniref:DNA polymerase III subunit delta n=1 Tax=Agrilactobacillus yilanensis TaxID=2485997 RepID=UPI001CDCE641|nr:DNA polymerase III subunit delta [Agrilactobacillus yilanensis]
MQKSLKKGDVQPVYLVLGQEDYLIQQVKTAFMALLDDAERAMNFASYDMTVDPLGAALDDGTSVPFFGDRRLVFVTQPFFLTSETPKLPITHDIAGLEAYLAHPLPTTVFVLFAKVAKLDGRKKISKQLQKQATVIDVQKLNGRDVDQQLMHLIQTKGYDIDAASRELLVQRSDGDFSAIVANLQKLFLAADDKKITKTMVADLVSPTLENNIFDLVDYVLHKNTQAAIMLYRDLLLNKEEPIKINSILLNQFRLLLQVKILAQKGMTQGSLTEILKIHPYRIKLALQSVRQFSMSDLTAAFLGLQENDYKMKSGQADKVLLFELFMLKFANIRS